MAIVVDQPMDYVNPIQGFILGLGTEELLANAKKVNIVLNQATVDHQGMALWHISADDMENNGTLISATLNGKGVCTISRPNDGGEEVEAVCAIQLSLSTMYSYEYPFASLRGVDLATPIAEFNRKAWGIWMHTSDGQEVASYLMDTSEQCRLCCVGTVTNSEYEMIFYSNGSKIGKVMNDLIADRIYSYEAFVDKGNGNLNRIMAKIEFNQNSTGYTKSLCIMTLLALSCYNLVTFFNPKVPPPRRRKRRR